MEADFVACQNFRVSWAVSTDIELLPCHFHNRSPIMGDEFTENCSSSTQCANSRPQFFMSPHWPTFANQTLQKIPSIFEKQISRALFSSAQLKTTEEGSSVVFNWTELKRLARFVSQNLLKNVRILQRQNFPALQTALSPAVPTRASEIYHNIC